MWRQDGIARRNFYLRLLNTTRSERLSRRLYNPIFRVDIWSAGCIFAELIMRRQLFPGKDAVSQVKMIIYYLGTPEKEVSRFRMFQQQTFRF